MVVVTASASYVGSRRSAPLEYSGRMGPAASSLSGLTVEGCYGVQYTKRGRHRSGHSSQANSLIPNAADLRVYLYAKTPSGKPWHFTSQPHQVILYLFIFRHRIALRRLVTPRRATAHLYMRVSLALGSLLDC